MFGLHINCFVIISDFSANGKLRYDFHAISILSGVLFTFKLALRAIESKKNLIENLTEYFFLLP